jgi:hypothetical protein
MFLFFKKKKIPFLFCGGVWGIRIFGVWGGGGGGGGGGDRNGEEECRVLFGWTNSFIKIELRFRSLMIARCQGF